MEGMTFRPMTTGSTLGMVAGALGVIAIPLSFCGGVGIVPGVLAIGLGLYSWLDRPDRGLSGARLGVALGVIATLISGGLFLLH